MLSRCRAVLESGLRDGRHIGAQLYVSLNGEVVEDSAIGESRPGVAMTPQTIMLWLSAGKPIVAVGIAILWERGLLQLDDLVTRHIPEFAANGKGAVTIRHILTHTAGFRGGETGWPDHSWDEIIGRVINLRQEPSWTPGKKAGYHLHTSWFVLAELIRRLDGRDFAQFMREEIFAPLGMNNSFFAVTAAEYAAFGNRLGIMHNTEKGAAVATTLDSQASCTVARPGGGAHGPARELGRFYEMMLGHGQLEAARILLPQTVEAMVSRHRTGMYDNTFKHVMDWGLGFMVNSPAPDAHMPYGFGPYASPRAFGHGGAMSTGGLADPEHGLVTAYILNGMAGEARHQERVQALTAAIYEDLGLSKV